MGKTALIIDDDREVLKNFNRLLKENGYEVYGVMTGKEAIDQVNQRCFDILLVDFRLPDIDGTDLLVKMGDKVNGAVKIMITGFATLETRIKALELGIDAFVEKPIDSDELLLLIEKNLSRKKSSRKK